MGYLYKELVVMDEIENLREAHLWESVFEALNAQYDATQVRLEDTIRHLEQVARESRCNVYSRSYLEALSETCEQGQRKLESCAADNQLARVPAPFEGERRLICSKFNRIMHRYQHARNLIADIIRNCQDT